jgi:hypothetical protein
LESLQDEGGPGISTGESTDILVAISAPEIWDARNENAADQNAANEDAFLQCSDFRQAQASASVAKFLGKQQAILYEEQTHIIAVDSSSKQSTVYGKSRIPQPTKTRIQRILLVLVGPRA